MRIGALVAVAGLIALSCGGSTPVATARPTASPSPSAPAATSPSPSPSPTASNYGLLLSAGSLEMVAPTGSVAAQATVAPPSVQSCVPGMAAVLQPPASATIDKVFFRDGDTNIRYLTPGGQTGPATTVPGGPTTISFFSVSPDDQRIAVLVEDLSGASTINLRLYVEDVQGQGHHADLLTTTTPKGKGGSTLWLMGWHQSQLVLAVVPACTFEALPAPSEWQVIDAATGARVADIPANNCLLSWWPSPAGVACVKSSGPATVFDWTGKAIRTMATQPADSQSSLSPSGTGILFATGIGVGAPPPATRIVGATASTSVAGHAACLWIDEDHVLAPDAVIAFPSGTVNSLPAIGVCAGRFPGAL